MGVGICTRDGLLRLYGDVDVDIGDDEDGEESVERGCVEVRLLEAMRLSGGRGGDEEVVCLGLVFVKGRDGGRDCVVVFGSGNCAVRVFVGGDVVVEPLDGGGGLSGGGGGRRGLSGFFYSALRSLGGGEGKIGEKDLVRGVGKFRLVGCGVGADGECFAVYRGGNVLKWGEDALVWTWNVLDVLQQGLHDPAERALVDAAVTSNGTVVVLAAKRENDTSEVHKLYLLGIKEGEDGTAPDDVAVTVDVDLNVRDIESVQFVVSGDLVYIACPEDERVVWSSVTPGVSSSEQVRGKADILDSMSFVQAIDLAYSLNDSVATGGAAAFLSADSVLLVKSGVPAPVVSMARYGDSEEGAVSRADALVQRAYLQYAANQLGASKATLSSIVVEAFSEEEQKRSFALEALGEAVSLASRDIIDDSIDATDAPMSLLIDTRLDNKATRHEPLMRLLAHGGFLSEVISPEQFSSGRLWDLIPEATRAEVMSDAEKLAAAVRLRKVENTYSDRGKKSRFLDDDMSTAPSFRSRSQFGSVNDDEEETGPSVIAEALRIAAESGGISSAQENNIDGFGVLYEKVSFFDRVLPALEKNLSDGLDNLRDTRKNAESSEEKAYTSLSSLRRFTRQRVLLANEAALAIVLGAADCRETISESLHICRGRGSVSWSCGRESCRNSLAGMIEVTLEAAKACRTKEAHALQDVAFHLADALLMCGQHALVPNVGIDCTDSRQHRRRIESPRKRRRVGSPEAASLWRQERRDVLKRLVGNIPDDRCLELAVKYEDFGMMLQLKCAALDFDDYFEEWVSTFGQDFGLFAFKWLEERGEFKLVLRGREDDTGVAVRSDLTKTMVDEYFRDHRPEYSNLSWMHYLGQGNMEKAAIDSQNQASALTQPGKEGALENTKLLYSIAKLAVHAGQAEDKEEQSEHLDHKLFLLRANERFDDGKSALMKRSDIIKRIVDEAPIETKTFADDALRALQSVDEVSSDEVKNQLRDYIWKRTVERESHIWIPLTARAASMTDTKLRAKLGNTAFCSVAHGTGLDSVKLQEMIRRGTFDVGDTSDEQQLKKLHTLLQTTTLVEAK